MPSEAVMKVGVKVERHLLEIEKLFKPHCKITLLVRNPKERDGNLLLSVDDLDEVTKAIEALKSKKAIEPGMLHPTSD